MRIWNNTNIKAIGVPLFMILLSLSSAFAQNGQKEIYIPRFMQNMDMNDCSSQWCYDRSTQTDNYIIFWEAGFGNDPSTASGDYQVNMDAVKEVAEKSFAVNVDSLRMVIKGSSVTDRYKQMIFILYTTEWAAFGAGQDDLVGSLHVNPAAANRATVLSHEIGHTFQYLAGCDSDGGFRYGFGPNTSGGNGFWEQSAQWQSFQVYPEAQFTTGNFNSYIRSNHLHILHETPRYDNYFLPDYWTFKHGLHFMGTLWRDSRSPEDPVEAYKRLTNTSQQQFNDEMYEHASRLTTWDLPRIRSYGANYIDRRPQVNMNSVGEYTWMVDPAVTIENYGYNSIKLNPPAAETVVSVQFTGKAGEPGYRSLNIEQGGWRFGFVALLQNGTRVYSEMASLQYANGTNPQGSLAFTVPNNCSRLWLVVSGAPQEHWRHAWDDDDTNDEQWPYQVQFANTNLQGEPNPPATPIEPPQPPEPPEVPQVQDLAFTVTMEPRSDYTSNTVSLEQEITQALGISVAEVSEQFGNTIQYYGLNPDGSLNGTSTANAPGHWYSATGTTVAYSAQGNEQAMVYSELNMQTLTASIGQYPNRPQAGSSYTIRQALVYHKSLSESIQLNLTYTVTIAEDAVILTQNQPKTKAPIPFLNSTLNALLQPNSTLLIYDMKGSLRASIKATNANIQQWQQGQQGQLGQQLGITQKGAYTILLIHNNRVQAVQSYIH
jgi:hypothetical protein